VTFAVSPVEVFADMASRNCPPVASEAFQLLLLKYFLLLLMEEKDLMLLEWN
jgi:hypothetical protein